MIAGLNQEIRELIDDLLEPAHPIFELRSGDRGIASNDAAEALYPRSQKIELMGYRAVRSYVYIFIRLETGVC